jgi:hypothetical protein
MAQFFALVRWVSQISNNMVSYLFIGLWVKGFAVMRAPS